MKKTLFLSSMFAGALAAQAVDPAFTQTIPYGGQRGTEVEVRLLGTRLEDAQEVMFYDQGITVTKFEPVKDDKGNVRNNEVRATLKIASDCRLGEHALRIRTATGVTPVNTFYVGTLPLVEEKEPNNEFAKAQKVALNTTVEGRVDSEDVDYYQIEAKKGDRLSVEIEGIRLGYTMYDAHVAVMQQDGKVIADNDDTGLFVQDPVLSVVIPQDGVYYVQIRESSYGGSSRAFYRAHIGTFARPLAVYPAGGRAGETVKVQWIGDAKGTFEQVVKLPANVSGKWGLEIQQNGQVTPSAMPFRVSSFPNLMEEEPNNELKLAKTNDVHAPVALNGIISEKGDIDFFRFKARKGQNFHVNVFARRIGSDLDPVLNIYDGAGKSIAGNDDSGGTPDSYLRFSVPADGDYVVRVTDQLGRGGPGFVYRVELEEVGEQLVTSIPYVARNDSQTRQAIAIPRGNQFATIIAADRKEFRGDLEFYAENLPPGVRLSADVMPGNQNQFILVFEAAKDAPIGGRIADLKARVVEKDKKREIPTVHRQVLDLVMSQPNNQVYYASEVQKLAVVVTEEAPFNVRIEPTKAPIAQYGTKDLKVVVQKKEGFDENITLELPYRPPGINANPRVTIPKGKTEVDYTLNSSANAETRSWKVSVHGYAPYKGGTLWTSSTLADIEVVPRFVIGKIDAATTERGKSVKVICKLEQKEPFNGEAVMELQGLPSNTTAEKKKITKDSTEVVFDVLTTDKSPTGLHKQLFVTFEWMRNGEPVKHTVATSGLLRIDAPKAPAVASSKQ